MPCFILVLIDILYTYDLSTRGIMNKWILAATLFFFRHSHQYPNVWTAIQSHYPNCNGVETQKVIGNHWTHASKDVKENIEEPWWSTFILVVKETGPVSSVMAENRADLCKRKKKWVIKMGSSPSNLSQQYRQIFLTLLK